MEGFLTLVLPLLALAWGVVMVVLAMRGGRKLSKQLHELRELRGMHEKLGELTRVNQGETRLADLEQELSEIKGVLRSVESHLRAMLVTRQGERAAEIEDVIRRWCRGSGYDEVQIMSDTSRLGAAPSKVRVEARKGGVAYKGHVVVQKDQVLEGRLLPAYEAFP
jgi:hypothetical protein